MIQNDDKCPVCRRLGVLRERTEIRPVKVRGETFQVPVTFHRCDACGEESEPLGGIGPDPLKLAYRAYRTRHGLLQPEEIAGLRKGAGLTQKELATLLGWGDVTISRYETGALQDEAHDVALRLALESPTGLAHLLRHRGHLLPGQRRTQLSQRALLLSRWRGIDHAMLGSYRRPDGTPGLVRMQSACRLVDFVSLAPGERRESAA